MAIVKTSPSDPAELLNSPEEIIALVDAAFEDGDPGVIADALGAVARSRGMSQISRQTGLAREALYRSLSSEGNPTLSTVLQVLKALGLQIHVGTAERQLEHV